jgi:hypothetical protein
MRSLHRGGVVRVLPVKKTHLAGFLAAFPLRLRWGDIINL